ncbi:Fimbrial assembly family protein [Syntrophobacter sp. SbD1]|nr:Fimbrial assembly family protein [Syntrophobacter sp. SbD1]
MLESIIKYRPTNLSVVYVEPRRIEVVHAHRHWRSWEIGAAEQFHVPNGESVFDHLQYLNMKPKGRKGSALLVILSSVFYSVHNEYYPLSIKEHLDETINFDWQENLFQEHERTLHFFGPSIALNQHVSVPIFSIQTDTYDKLNQALNGTLFHSFAVAPGALGFSALLPLVEDAGEESEIVARCLDDDNLELHRFYRGAFLESTVIGKSSHNMKLFVENLKCTGTGEFDPHIHLVWAPGECKSADPAAGWEQAGLPIKVREISESLVTSWLRRLLKQDTIHTFDSEILLKPWQIPRIAAPLAALILVFGLYGLYQSHSSENMVQTSKRIKVEINQLETRWKPIEELQTRIKKFEEDQKTLTEFNHEDYQLLELMSFLTQLTPDDTSLNYLSLRKGQLILRGESKSALKYQAELSKTEGLTDVKFASPVTRAPENDMERFNVQLQLDMDKLKKSLDALPPETNLAAPDTEKAAAIQCPPPPVEEQQAEQPPEQGATAEEQAPEENQQ